MSGSFHLHLVSDSTGETVISLARACLAQFPEVEPQQHLWCLVRGKGQIRRVITGIESHPGIVFYTLVDPVVRGELEESCRRLSLPCIGILDPVMNALSDYLHIKVKPRPGLQHVTDAAYYKRIDAIQFTIAHDDGQSMDDLEDSDVVVTGVSRTSKTPTCMYLANRGLKVANVPLVPDVPPPPELLSLKKPLVVALTRDAKGLAEIRRNRLRFLAAQGGSHKDDYADYEKVRAEIAAARRLYARHGWPVIDMTKRSIEEAAAAILQLYVDRTGHGVEVL